MSVWTADVYLNSGVRQDVCPFGKAFCISAPQSEPAMKSNAVRSGALQTCVNHFSRRVTGSGPETLCSEAQGVATALPRNPPMSRLLAPEVPRPHWIRAADALAKSRATMLKSTFLRWLAFGSVTATL